MLSSPYSIRQELRWCSPHSGVATEERTELGLLSIPLRPPISTSPAALVLLLSHLIPRQQLSKKPSVVYKTVLSPNSLRLPWLAQSPSLPRRWPSAARPSTLQAPPRL